MDKLMRTTEPLDVQERETDAMMRTWALMMSGLPATRTRSPQQLQAQERHSALAASKRREKAKAGRKSRARNRR